MATITDRIPFVTDPFQVASSLTVYLTAPSGGTELKTEITELYVTNDTTTSATLSVYAAPSGGSGDATNIIFNTITVLPQDRVVLADREHPISIEPDGTIEMIASAASQLTVHMAGDHLE